MKNEEDELTLGGKVACVVAFGLYFVAFMLVGVFGKKKKKPC